MHNISGEEVTVLRQATRMVVRELGLLSEAYFDIGVTLAERHLLIELESCLYPNVGDIAERLLLDKSSASRLIAKAVKKGFVIYSIDENDKRKRYLQITDQGRQTLAAFEPIAQKQVVDALQNLSEEETKIVHQGMILFAKGLGMARLRNTVSVDLISPQDNIALAHLNVSVSKQTGSEALNSHADPKLQTMYEAYQQSGHAYFVLKKKSKIIGGAGIVPFNMVSKETRACQLSKVCLSSDFLNLGLEDLLIEACLEEAQRQRYRTCFANGVDNVLWEEDLYLRHGFTPVAKKKRGAAKSDYHLILEKDVL